MLKGVKRGIDELGRVCIPRNYRRQLGIDGISAVDIELVDKNTIMIKRHNYQISYNDILIKLLMINERCEKSKQYNILKEDILELERLVHPLISKIMQRDQ